MGTTLRVDTDEVQAIASGLVAVGDDLWERRTLPRVDAGPTTSTTNALLDLLEGEVADLATRAVRQSAGLRAALADHLDTDDEAGRRFVAVPGGLG